MADDELPIIELAFPGPERDSGVAAILSGEKTAMAGLLQLHLHAGEALPEPGQRFSVVDSAGRRAAVIEFTEVRVTPLGQVGDEYARAEGRGYSGAAQWRRAHEDLFRGDGMAALPGATPQINDDTLVVTERFRLVEPDPR